MCCYLRFWVCRALSVTDLTLSSVQLCWGRDHAGTESKHKLHTTAILTWAICDESVYTCMYTLQGLNLVCLLAEGNGPVNAWQMVSNWYAASFPGLPSALVACQTKCGEELENKVIQAHRKFQVACPKRNIEFQIDQSRSEKLPNLLNAIGQFIFQYCIMLTFPSSLLLCCCCG